MIATIKSHKKIGSKKFEIWGIGFVSLEPVASFSNFLAATLQTIPKSSLVVSNSLPTLTVTVTYFGFPNLLIFSINPCGLGLSLATALCTNELFPIPR